MPLSFLFFKEVYVCCGSGETMSILAINQSSQRQILCHIRADEFETTREAGVIA